MTLILLPLINFRLLLVDLVLENFHLHTLTFLEMLLINLDSIVDVV